MTRANRMTRERRIELLEAICRGLGYGEAENTGEKRVRLFLPLPMHRLALRPETVVIRGGRGAGKSALFAVLKQLQDPASRRSFFGDPELPEAPWVDAFSQMGIAHPDVTVLDAFAEHADQAKMRVFWMGHLLGRLTKEQPDVVTVPAAFLAAWQGHESNPAAWIDAAQANLGVIAQALDDAHTRLEAAGETVFAAYDMLDRIGLGKPEVRSRCISALLSLWLSFANRYRNLRAKIFLRDDLLDAGELGFADASKLKARSVALEWNVAALYRLVMRHFAEASDDLRVWLEQVKHGLVVEDRGSEFGWMPDNVDEDVQYWFATQLAGEVMGSGVKKGFTYTWIPNHLQDSQGRIVPRSMLNLLAFSAEDALQNPLGRKGLQLMTPQNLIAGLAEASRRRVEELKEEYPVVLRLKNLEGAILLLEPGEVISRLSQPVHGDRTTSTDGAAIYEELRRIGVLSVRADGRVDVPDIYRTGFGIKRKGGARRAR